MYVLWKFDIATEDYMVFNACLIVTPSLVEVILEVRNFLKISRIKRSESVTSTTFNGQNL